MKIGVLTSSRADYGIYKPLLKTLSEDMFFDLNLIVFGTHLSEKFGCSINQIYEDGFKIITQIDTLPETDSALDISKAIGKTIFNLSDFWEKEKFDLVFALGDRFEMFAAVTASLPFNQKIAHIHGGETTLGAIDNVFRHSITAMAEYHFTATEFYKNRVIELIGHSQNVYNVGSLSIENINNVNFLSIAQFKKKYNIDLSISTILITFHPETVNFQMNKKFISEFILTLENLSDYQLVITMPNADTMGNYIRQKLIQFINSSKNAIGVENFGVLGYLSCMKHCSFLLGNTSSGFIEAYGLQKPVVNIGNRQKGRLLTSNIINVPIVKNEILKAIQKIKTNYFDGRDEIYGNGKTAEKIIQILKRDSET